LKGIQESTDLDAFFKAVIKLKSVRRKGWKDKLGMKNPESVAEHCFAMSAIAMVLSDQKKLDTHKVLKMALLHDLAEALVGDITPEQMPRSKKKSLEDAAMKTILQTLDSTLRGSYWRIWQEYQEQKTKESVFLHQIDKLEMALQAKVYHVRGHSESQIRPFLTTAKRGIKDASLARFVPKL